MNIFPRDVAQVGGGLMYVRSISTPDKFGNVAIEGVRATDQTASCTLHKDDEVEAVAVNVSRSEAQEWFDRESRLNLIVGEMRALYGRMLSFVSNSNKTVYIYTEEVDGDLAWDAALCPGGETLPEFPAMFSGITNDEEEKNFFTKAEGKFLKVEDVNYDEVENSVTFTVTA